MALDRIVVGVDGSDNSHRALEWAARLAEAVDAEVLAVHALGLLERLSPDGELTPAAPHRDEITRLFEERWCAPLDDHPTRSRRMVVDGPPVMVLLRVADDESADLLVVGSRGRGGFPGMLLGSTSAQLAQHAHVPVVIIPPDDRRPMS